MVEMGVFEVDGRCVSFVGDVSIKIMVEFR